MNKKLFDLILHEILSKIDDPDARKSLIEGELSEDSVINYIDLVNADQPLISSRWAHLLSKYGAMPEGNFTVADLLENLRDYVITAGQAQINGLLTEPTTLPIEQFLSVLPSAFDESTQSVFISYARPDEAVAEKIELFLKAAGKRVFRDTSQIHDGANWDMSIEDALRTCGRMVLILSSESMPYRKEVHREWFYFDQKRKPIYPFYIQDCDLHSRLYAYNYIDARNSFQGALDRLLQELELNFELPDVSTGADKIGVFSGVDVETRTFPEALQALLEAVRDPEGNVVLSFDQANAIKSHKPIDLTEFRLGRVAEWSLPRYALDNRFINLTLLLDREGNEPQRWQPSSTLQLNDLSDVMRNIEDPVVVLLGAPGSGKSTLLRRFELERSIDRLRDSRVEVSFLIQLNMYRARPDGVIPEPRTWLEARWNESYPDLPSLNSYLKAGHGLLLIDGLNEMPHKTAGEYHERVSLWRNFAQECARQGNRLIFTCRSLDYSASLSSSQLRVPQIEVKPMTDEQVRAFLKVYSPAHEALIWQELHGSPQISLFQTPYFLKLLCDQVEETRALPKGRASLFTGFVRRVLYREMQSDLFQPDALLTERDHQKLTLGKWRDYFELPERGVLIPKLSDLAFRMQEKGLKTEGAQVRIDFENACELLNCDHEEDILNAGIALNILDHDIARNEIAFFHQLLQEFFAARKLARTPTPILVKVDWKIDEINPPFHEVLKLLAVGDPLPPLPQTGWEETTLTAAPMAHDPNAFIRDLMLYNLPLSARCAASSELSVDSTLKQEIQSSLISRMQDPLADPRARISAGEALGILGDPRFEHRKGPDGDYLLPPMATIPAGVYFIGADDSVYADEKPAHAVALPPFAIGVFPVTNAEFSRFIASGGYEEEQWWEGDEARAWLRGEGPTEGQKEIVRGIWTKLQSWSDNEISASVARNLITPEQGMNWIKVKGWSKARLEQQLERWYPSGRIYHRPEFWNDTRFNNPAQPVVGVTWFEARAYCKWLSMQDGQSYDLPSEVQFEAAARGVDGLTYPYGTVFDTSRSNAFESRIGRTTPVGIFNNAGPIGVYDLAGNAYSWTRSIYDLEKFPYPYRADDGRENIKLHARRVLRGGSWADGSIKVRAAFRNYDDPNFRSPIAGFRLSRPVLEH